MEDTKKIPVAVSNGDYKTKSNEFIVPDPSSYDKLIGIKSGQEFPFGAISYIGKRITISDILTKMYENGITIQNEEAYRSVLSLYIDELYRFKISNIVRLETTGPESLTLAKVPKTRNTRV